MAARRGNLAGEVNALREYWALRADPVYRGHGVPRGDGKAVLVLPGMFGNDIYLQPLRSWLGRIGYKPTVSTININAGCSRRLIERVEAGLARKLENTESPVAIIGHSRGGMLGKAITSRLGDRCAHFIALGSPVGQILRSGKEGMIALAHDNSDADAQLAAPSVVQAGRRAMKFFDPDCDSPFCDCAYMRDLLAPRRLPFTRRKIRWSRPMLARWMAQRTSRLPAPTAVWCATEPCTLTSQRRLPAEATERCKNMESTTNLSRKLKSTRVSC